MDKMKVEGNLGAKRKQAASAFFGRKIKKAGEFPQNYLPYRKPKIEGGQGPRAV